MKLLYQSRWLKRQACYIQTGSSTIASISKFENSDATRIKTCLQHQEGTKYGKHWFLSWNQCLNLPVICFNSTSDSKYKVLIDA